ncbi:MAG: OmpA family protein [Zoogloeaceae bacterium]|jgi:outer membrane protein OmpA-like peptidoglycan-associated protein|nr:OmpA family protein [Zoogloeaceae bacterium]
MKSIRVLFALMSLSLFAACGDKGAEPAATGESPAAPVATAPAAREPAPTPAEPAPAENTAAAFDINRIPVTDKPLGEFPFFTPPEGYKYVSCGNCTYFDEKKSVKGFDRYYFATSTEALHPVEGKTFRVRLYGTEKQAFHNLEELLIERNYENAIVAAGGVKVFDGKPDYYKTYKALDRVDNQRYGPSEAANDRRQTYVIRRADAEVWIDVSCAYDCTFAVAQKGEMKQSVGLIPASEMKDALDKEGHVALYINFDVDKATIRPESQDIVTEIFKLLEANPDLKIRIEGHTDNTGEAAHNQTLSENRASAVFGSLLAKGIPQNRLEAKGFGASNPIADNKTEEGRAKNRRVEIVKL